MLSTQPKGRMAQRRVTLSPGRSPRTLTARVRNPLIAKVPKVRAGPTATGVRGTGARAAGAAVAAKLSTTKAAQTEAVHKRAVMTGF